MALHLRKLLSAETDDKKDVERPVLPCYICYNCDPDECLSPPPQTVPHHRMPTVLIVMLCVLALAFLILSYLTVGRYRNSRRRLRPGAAVAAIATESEEESREDDSEGPVVDHHVWYIRTVGFPQSVIDSIAVFRYKRGEGLIEGTDCSVCLNEFGEDESLRLLPKCSHAFHLPCIDTWLRAHKNCPVCRAPIMVPNGAANVPPPNTLNADGQDLVNQAGNESESGQEVDMGESRAIMSGPGNGPTMPAHGDTAKARQSLDSTNENVRVLSDLVDCRVKMDQVLQSIRRTASLDFSAASMISQTMVNKEGHLDKRGCKNSGIDKLIKSASFGRSFQKGPVLMKRSLSFTGKRPLRKNNRAISAFEIVIHK